jgi:hypothetical protein
MWWLVWSIHIVATHSATVTLYVNSAFSTTSLPCGGTQASSCSTVLAAYQSIALLSNSSLDKAVILLNPGVHSVCNLSYFTNIAQTKSNVTSSIVIQALDASVGATISCDNSSYDRMLNVDGVYFNLLCIIWLFQFARI